MYGFSAKTGYALKMQFVAIMMAGELNGITTSIYVEGEKVVFQLKLATVDLYDQIKIGSRD